MAFDETSPVEGHNRPPYKYVEGVADMTKILIGASLDPSLYGTRDFIARQGLAALWELFSDGELRVLTLDQFVAPGDLQREEGQERYGEFYEKIDSLQQNALQEGGPMADEIHKLARFCGSTLAEYVIRGSVQLPDAKLVSPSVSAIDGRALLTFDEYRWRSPHDVGVVLEYGPGIGGKKFMDAQLAALSRHLPPFQYVAISNGPFVNQFMVTYLSSRLAETYGPEARALATSGSLFVGREDGMQQATKELLATPQPSGTHEICDAILLTGVHQAEASELEFTIKSSPQLLRQDGKLLLSAPLDKVKPDFTPFANQLQWAQAAGYVVEWRSDVLTGDPNLGTNTMSGLAVLHKWYQ